MADRLEQWRAEHLPHLAGGLVFAEEWTPNGMVISCPCHERIVTDGPPRPVRVMIDHEGQATTPRRAADEHGLAPDILLVRNDGWVLGAPDHLANIARATWRGQWVEEWKLLAGRWTKTWPLPAKGA